ncbi:cytochrome c oxidase assembly protein [Sphingomonas sp. NPDC019816]|uniref:cytochrome c oxidase assembly protein n=1 Tax=Sphingomonas sp. NPDC019816 TaxID=3390679 RepID=UPI003D01CC5D
MIDFIGSYCGSPPTAATWALRWNGDVFLIAVLVLGAMGMVRLNVPRRRAGLIAVGVLAIAFLSPLCALSVALFSARTLHHLLLIGVAAPLLAIAVPTRSTPPPAIAFALATVLLWVWHLPAAYDAALANKALYWVMQASLLGSAWAYWLAVRRADPPVALALIGAGAAQMGFLGAILTFAARPLYASHLSTTVPFGIGPLADQQLAGLAMWVLGLVPYAVVGATILRTSWRWRLAI